MAAGEKGGSAISHRDGKKGRLARIIIARLNLFYLSLLLRSERGGNKNYPVRASSSFTSVYVISKHPCNYLLLLRRLASFQIKATVYLFFFFCFFELANCQKPELHTVFPSECIKLREVV